MQVQLPTHLAISYHLLLDGETFVGFCLFLPSCAMYKDNAVGNVVAGTGRDLVFMITARLSDLSIPLKGEVRRSPEQSARLPIARSGKFVRHAYLGEGVGL